MTITIRNHLSTQETVADLASAAEDRYWESLECMVSGHWHAGIYLGGYAAEMWLKFRAFELGSAQPGDLVPARLSATRRNLRTLPGGLTLPPDDNWHSLLFWLEYIFLMPYPSRTLQDQTAARDRVRGLYDSWKVDMRYRSAHRTEPHPGDGLAILNDFLVRLSWLRTNHRQL